MSAAPGINGAPSWAPDGRRLVFTLSQDGNPEIYALDLASQYPFRLTSSSSMAQACHDVSRSSPELWHDPLVARAFDH